MAVQTEYQVHANPMKPRALSLTLNVTSMDFDSITALKVKLDDFARDLAPEFDVDGYEIKAV